MLSWTGGEIPWGDAVCWIDAVGGYCSEMDTQVLGWKAGAKTAQALTVTDMWGFMKKLDAF